MSKINPDRIWAVLGVLVAVVAVIISVTTPEIRRWMGLDPPASDTTTIAPAPLPGKQQKGDKTLPAAGSGKTTPADGAGKQATQVYTYRGMVVDSLERPVGGVRVLCSTCEQQQTTTNAQGQFLLEKRYAEGDEFRQEAVTFSNSARSITLHLNWREHAPIKF